MLAPAYTEAAVHRSPERICTFLAGAQELEDEEHEDEAGLFCRYGLLLHHTLCVASENPVFTLVLNGFQDLHQRIGGLFPFRRDA